MSPKECLSDQSMQDSRDCEKERSKGCGKCTSHPSFKPGVINMAYGLQAWPAVSILIKLHVQFDTRIYGKRFSNAEDTKTACAKEETSTVITKILARY